MIIVIHIWKPLGSSRYCCVTSFIFSLPVNPIVLDCCFTLKYLILIYGINRVYAVEVSCLGLLCNIDEGSVRYFQDEIIQLQSICNGMSISGLIFLVHIHLTPKCKNRLGDSLVR